MAVNAGKGFVLQVSINSTFTSVFQMVELESPQIENPPIDITTLDSTWRLSVGSIPDGGSLSFTALWDPTHATHTRLVTGVTNGTIESWKLISSTTTNTITFQGHMTQFGVGNIVVDDVARVSGTIKVTSAVTIST